MLRKGAVGVSLICFDSAHLPPLRSVGTFWQLNKNSLSTGESCSKLDPTLVGGVKGAIARTESQQRSWRFFWRQNENNKSNGDPIQQAVKPKNHGCLTGPPPRPDDHKLITN